MMKLWDRVVMKVNGFKTYEELRFSREFPDYCYKHRMPKPYMECFECTHEMDDARALARKARDEDARAFAVKAQEEK
jgi:hypothetical protein